MVHRRISLAALMLHLAAGLAFGASPEKLIQPVSIGGQGANGRAAGKLDAARPMMRELQVAHIQKTIQRYLEGEWGVRVKGVQVTVVEPASPIKIPVGVIELQVLPSVSEGGMGRRSFSLHILVDGKPWKSVEALADIAALIDVVVPNRFLKSDEIVEAEDLTVSRIVTYDLKHPFLTSPDAVVGKSAARPLQPNTPLRQAFLKNPVMVKKGDHVLIEARRGGLSIQTSGVTKGSGQVGQTVMVANLESGRELRAKIVAPGLVQVDF